MPSYRTTSLFHYTKTADNLFNILSSGKLIPNYCKEDLSFNEYNSVHFRNNKTGLYIADHFIWGIPMICFCDIPILSAGDFLENYGKYCIAFNKEWGKQKGCNPVQYVNNDKILGSLFRVSHRIEKLQKIEETENKDITLDIINALKRLIIEESKLENKNAERKLNIDYILTGKDKSGGEVKTVFYLERGTFRVSDSYLDMVHGIDNESKLYYYGFLKKYESEWKGKPYENYKENEWRFIVEETDSIKWLYNEDYEKWRGDKENNPKPKPTEALIEKSLKFSVSDINHIILYEESEIPAFIRRIRELEKIGNIVLDADTKDILISKISSFERIQKDY